VPAAALWLRVCSGRYLEQRPANRLQQKQCLRGLLPQPGIVAPEPIKGAIVDIAQAQKATGQVSDRGERWYVRRHLIIAVRPFLRLRTETERRRSPARTGSFLWLYVRPAKHGATFADDVRLNPEQSVSIEMIRRSRQSREANRSTSSRSTAVRAS
jgi:hypothetical protein